MHKIQHGRAGQGKTDRGQAEGRQADRQEPLASEKAAGEQQERKSEVDEQPDHLGSKYASRGNHAGLSNTAGGAQIEDQRDGKRRTGKRREDGEKRAFEVAPNGPQVLDRGGCRQAIISAEGEGEDQRGDKIGDIVSDRRRATVEDAEGSEVEGRNLEEDGGDVARGQGGRQALEVAGGGKPIIDKQI